MKDAVTNFGVMMDILGIQPRELSVSVGSDKTLVSRWRTGERKLVTGRRWVKGIAAYFIEVDAASEDPILPSLLHRIYPTESLEGVGLLHVLERWLSTEGQHSPEYQEKRRAIMLDHFSKKNHEESPPTNVTAIGEEAVREKLLDFLEQLAMIPGEGEMVFVCPEGLALLTSDEVYAEKLMEKLLAIFKTGKTLIVVLRTDFRMSEVAYFSGPWLVAHLMGYIRSWYYDDFRLIESDKMIAVFEGKIAGIVSPYGRNGKDVQFTIEYDRSQAEKLTARCREYLDNSAQRFHYSFFQKPDSFLKNTASLTNGPCFFFSRLPRLCLGDAESLADAGLSGDEIDYIAEQFQPFLITPDMFDEKTRVCHVFCIDDIEEALDQQRQRFSELSDILGRRVIVSPQLLTNRLKIMRDLLSTHKNYWVSFMPASFFDKINMQIGVWGNEAAIAWISGGRSTACRDYTNVGALHGFCATLWDRIPTIMRTRAQALRKINVWLKRASRYGFDA